MSLIPNGRSNLKSGRESESLRRRKEANVKNKSVQDFVGCRIIAKRSTQLQGEPCVFAVFPYPTSREIRIKFRCSAENPTRIFTLRYQLLVRQNEQYKSLLSESRAMNDCIIVFFPFYHFIQEFLPSFFPSFHPKLKE